MGVPPVPEHGQDGRGTSRVAAPPRGAARWNDGLVIIPKAGRVGEERCRGTIASPLVEPDVRISLIRLSRKLSPLSSTPTEVGLAERHSLDLRWELFPNLAAGDP